MKHFDIFFDQDNNVYQVRTKTDTTTIEFTDPAKEQIFKDIVKLYDSRDKISYLTIQKLLNISDTNRLLDVVKELQGCDILNELNFETETPNISDLYPNEINHKPVSELTISYIGDIVFGKLVKSKSAEYNIKQFALHSIDEMTDEMIEYILKHSDFTIVDSLTWNPYKMRVINKKALEHTKPWLLIEGLTFSRKFSVGPIFYGRYTGCYDCYKNRVRSNDEFVNFNDSYERYLEVNNASAKPDLNIQPVVKDIAAAIVIADVLKYLYSWYPPETWKCCALINPSNYEVEKHTFIKAPICHSCKPELDYNPAPWLESVTLSI
jgi:bacteriocin biosynthesis cyclodehydratase domain-containing protein